jgi:hypothetical protein
VEGWKVDDDGRRFARCRLVGRDFKVKNEGDRDDLFASMPPLEAKKMLFRLVAGARGWRRWKNMKEMKLICGRVQKGAKGTDRVLEPFRILISCLSYFSTASSLSLLQLT